MSVQGGAEVERFGRTIRTFPLALSVGALALAWARQEQAPHGAAVVADREISPRGRHGALWDRSPEQTLACAVVLRPDLPADEADVLWLAGGLAAAAGARTTGADCRTWWPDAVVGGRDERVVATARAEIQLGPGQVRSAVVTVRVDLGSPGADRDAALEAVLRTLDELAAEDAGAIAAVYESHCAVLGRRVKLALLPKGETRGTAAHVTRHGELEVSSATGMVERVAVDALRELTPA